MLILPQTTQVTCRPNNKKDIESKGYNWKYNEKILINVIDLKETSQLRVKLLCDYCLEKGNNNVLSTPYNLHIKNKNNNLKDSCVECQGLKQKDVMLSRYGVTNPYHLPHVSEAHIQRLNKRKHKIENIVKMFSLRGYELISKEYVKNNFDLEYICLNHKQHGVQTISYANFNEGHGCYYCGRERMTDGQKGEKSHFWRGGITPLSVFMRDKTVKWKIDSLEFYQFKCVITGKQDRNLDVHHTYSFSDILKETLNELNLPTYYEINNYTEIQLNLIEKLLINKHYKYGLGVPLLHDVHNEFHRIYGKGNNTPEQFEDFKQKYLNNEYKVVN